MGFTVLQVECDHLTRRGIERVKLLRSHWTIALRPMSVNPSSVACLAQIDPRKVQVVEMRFFGGLSVTETAEVLKIAPVTVKRAWGSANALEGTWMMEIHVPGRLPTSLRFRIW
jgi:hypothetical protein